MKHNTLLFTALAMVSLLCSCSQQEEIMETVATAKGTTTIVASTGSGAAGTRIAFTDEDADGVKQAWEAGDRFLLYDDNGNYAATFTLKTGAGTSLGEFTTTEPLADGKTYTAVYPAVDNPAEDMPTLSHRTQIINGTTQNGNGNMAHINAQCYMDGTYTHSPTPDTPGTVQFAIAYVMMTVVMEKPDGYNEGTDGVPESLTFFNGDKSTHLSLENVRWNESEPIKAYMLVEPEEPEPGESRTLRFELLSENGMLFQKEVTSDKEYEAGIRYTAALKDGYKLQKITGYTRATLASIPTDLNTWVITDAITEKTNLSLLKLAIDGAERKITLVLPNATGIIIGAFQDCINLTTVNLPKATDIGQSAFSGCTNLTAVNLPEATILRSYAFNNCINLTTVNLPKATDIGEYALRGCTNLTAVNLPEATILRSSAFSRCTNLTTVNLPKATDIGQSAFSECTNLTAVNLPEATILRSYAFSNCINLTAVSLPKVISIDNNIFYHCENITTVNLPEVTSLSWSTFEGCTNLTTVNLQEVTSMSYSTFQDCTNLTAVDLPKATNIGSSTFKGCTNLTAVNLPKVTIIGIYAFYKCTSLTAINLPKTTNIGGYAFYECTSLTAINLPEATDIYSYVFYQCENLTAINLPKATKIDNNAFEHCASLRSLEIATGSTGLTNVGTHLFGGIYTLSYVDLTVGAGESENVDVETKTWREYAFKSITIR